MSFEVANGTMPARGFDWDSVSYPARPVREFAKLHYGKALRQPDRRPGAVPVFGTNGPCGWHDEPLAEGPGVILGRKGQGHLGVKWCSRPFWVIDTAYYAEINQGEADLRWFYYITEYVGLDHLKTGEKPGLNRDVFGRQVFPFPPLEDQLEIVRILGMLDDKIELNRDMSATLEGIARALFKSWFVDFDPVTAKAAGRQPFGMSADIAALFPDSFIDFPIGPIPEGWTLGTIADIAKYVNGRNFTKGASGDGRMVIRIAELNSGPAGSTVYNNVEAAPENTASPGDILFAWSGSLDVYRWCRDEALINQHIFKVICDRFPHWFVHQQLIEAMPFFQGIADDKATTMGHIKREHLQKAELAIPPDTLLDAVGQLVEPIYECWLANARESLHIEVTRDVLLPQLLSGEIRLRDAEKLVEEVA